MIKMLFTLAVLVSADGFAGLAVAQDNQANGGDVASALAKLEAQCAHRRIMPPDPRDDCARRLRNAAQLGYAQGGAYASQAGGAGPGIGPGNAGGPGNGIGPGNGGGAGKGGGKGGR